MFIPIIETGGKFLILQNYLAIIDKSTGENSVVQAIAKNGFEIEFYNEDADDILEQIEKLLELSDRAQLPIVGFDDTVLILPNFPLFEDNGDGDRMEIVLTDDTGKEWKYEADHAALILARLSSFVDQTQQLFQLTQQTNAESFS